MGKATRVKNKKAEEQRISQIGDFKYRMGGIMELPSGSVVKVKNPGGMKAFISGGLIPNSLMAIVQDSLKKGKAPKAEQFTKDGELDPQMIDDMTIVMDNVAIACFVEPKLHRAPSQEDVEKWNENNPDDQVEDPEDLRDDEQLYVDEIPDIDKQFLFQWVSGGTRDLEKFRKELESNMASVSKVAGPLGNTKRDDGPNAG